MLLLPASIASPKLNLLRKSASTDVCDPPHGVSRLNAASVVLTIAAATASHASAGRGAGGPSAEGPRSRRRSAYPSEDRALGRGGSGGEPSRRGRCMLACNLRHHAWHAP